MTWPGHATLSGAAMTAPPVQGRPAIPVGQHNFTHIKEDLAGCYRLATDIHLHGDLTQALPIGNLSHPFTGSLDGDGHSLAVNLTRSQGDAVLFGAIDHSRLNLTVTDSQLYTRNGSRAALIGTMGTENQVLIARLHSSLLRAVGQGAVEAGLVAATTGADNRLELGDARDNSLTALAFPAADAHRAHVSLGLGVIRASGSQFISQHRLEDNELHASAYSSALAPEQEGPRRRAIAGLLGLLEAETGAGQQLASRQDALHDNLVGAFTESTTTDEGISCASLGYAGIDCGSHTAVADSQRALDVSQADCKDNVIFPWVSRRLGNGTWTADELPLDGLARSSLVSTEAVADLRLLHRAIGPGQLQAVARQRQRALLPPAARASVLLLSGGDARIPLFGTWEGAHNCSLSLANDGWNANASLLDTLGYRTPGFNCGGNTTASIVGRDTRQPGDWRLAHFQFALFDKPAAARSAALRSGDIDNRLHYPHETLQSLARVHSDVFGKTWWLVVTRQTWPWQPEANSRGLLRITQYLAPDASHPLPRPVSTTPAGFQLNQARAGDQPLQEGVPVQHLGRLQLYQGPGQPAQLISLSGGATDEAYRLTQYHGLFGKARLLSQEDGQLYLWTQLQDADRNIVLAYGLGTDLSVAARKVGRGHQWYQPTKTFTMDNQPGGQVLLARSGTWLYSLRQQPGQPASLRRFYFNPLVMDTRWQATWPGNVTDGLRLVVDDDHLVALPTGTLVDPNRRDTGLQARVPDAGGPLQWERVALDRYPLPAANPSCASGCRGASGGAPAETAPPERLLDLRLLGIIVGAGFVPSLLAGCAIGCGAAACQRRRQQVAAQKAADEKPDAGWNPEPDTATDLQPVPEVLIAAEEAETL